MKKFCVFSYLFFMLSSVYASTLDSTASTSEARVNVNGNILNSQSCQLSVAQPDKEYTLNQSGVPNYGYFFEQGQAISNWSGRVKIPAYDDATHAFNFTLSCNFKSDSYRLKLDTSQAVTPVTINNAYNYLLLPSTATPNLGPSVGFVLMTDRGTSSLINIKNLQSQGNIDLGTFNASECGAAGLTVGKDGYCSMNFNLAAILVGGDTSLGLDSVNQFVPKTWVKENSYTLNLAVSVEFQ